jgi:protein-L-isoaspartate(D-aspartate) O-methyltransferase
MVAEWYLETPSADAAYIYQSNLVALDAGKGINNGEPFLHAAWIGAVTPQPGETVTHVGAGTGYYSAILSMLVLADGSVNAFSEPLDALEIRPCARSVRALQCFASPTMQ